MSARAAFHIELVPEAAAAARVVVVGLGNAGGRALAAACERGFGGPRAIVVAPSPPALPPEIEGFSPERDDASIDRALASADLVIVVASLGGASGAALAPPFVRRAREHGALVLAAVALPLALEGSRRVRRAAEALRAVAAEAHGTIPIDGAAASGPDAVTLGDARHAVDVTVHGVIDAIVAGFDPHARARVQLGELRALWRSPARLAAGRGVAVGPSRAHEAVGEAVLALGDHVLGEASAVLVGISGGADLRLHEVNAAAAALLELVGPRTEVLVSARSTPAAEGALAVTLLADVSSARRPVEPLASRHRGESALAPH
ncbi:MAG: hypothetical protein IT376_04525 [Polyangiaceae bacterium]|nr:hypothetical protein [Polyangiaceae bacterium]